MVVSWSADNDLVANLFDLVHEKETKNKKTADFQMVFMSKTLFLHSAAEEQNSTIRNKTQADLQCVRNLVSIFFNLTAFLSGVELKVHRPVEFLTHTIILNKNLMLGRHKTVFFSVIQNLMLADRFKQRTAFIKKNANFRRLFVDISVEHCLVVNFFLLHL